MRYRSRPVSSANPLDLVLNPSAGGGRAGRRLGAVEAALQSAGFAVRVHRTVGRKSLYDTVRRLVTDRHPTVGIMGGDGTFHDAMAALLSPDDTLLDASHTAFAVLPAGTGGDLAARTLGVPSEPEPMARWLKRARPAPFDLGRLEHRDDAGRPAVTLFCNVASCGLSGRVDALVARGPKWIGGPGAYLAASLRATLGWRHQPVRVTVDGDCVYDGPAMTVAVCNGRAFGAGMKIAPEARPDDGILEVVVLGDLGVAALAELTPRLYAGTHGSMAGVVTARGRRVTVDTPDRDVRLDVDGETPGTVPGVFSVIPGAVRVLRPAGTTRDER